MGKRTRSAGKTGRSRGKRSRVKRTGAGRVKRTGTGRGKGTGKRSRGTAKRSRAKGSRARRGGHVVRLNQDVLNRWAPIRCHGNDCVPGTCTFLGLGEREAMKHAAAMYPQGVSNESGITDYLDNRYQIKHAVYGPVIWTVNGRFTTNPFLFHDMLRTPGDTTVGLLYGPTRHAVAIGRTTNGDMILLDPQSCQAYQGLANIERYMRANKFMSLFLVSQFAPGAPRRPGDVQDYDPDDTSTPMDIDA